MTGRTFITAAEVAELLEFPKATSFLGRRLALERDHGFPPPVCFTRSPLKWRRSDVVRWIDGTYQPPDIAGAARLDGDANRRVLLLQEARRG